MLTLRRLIRNFSVDPTIIRNIGISAHIDSGKTTFSERVLFYSGRISKIHEVKGSDNVGATMDFMELEKEKGITIQSAATNVTWKNYVVNLIDTPGHVDFTIEVERALRVLDGAIMLVCGVSGVQPQTLTVDRQMKRYKVPRLIFINKLDRAGTNPWTAIDQIRKRLLLNVASLHVPIGLVEEHKGVIDVITKKAFYFEGDSGDKIRVAEMPPNYNDEVANKRKELIEKIADVDDELADAYLNEKDITIDMLKKAIRRTTIKRTFCPIFMGSALKNIGVQLALDGVIDYLPNPTEVINEGTIPENKKEEKIQLKIDNKKEFVGLAFKLEENKFGQLTYMRVYQGKVKKGDYLLNTRDQKRVKVSRIVKMHANQMEDISEANAGEIFALFGIDCNSGDTFTNISNIHLESMHVPEPVMSLSIKPTKKESMSDFMKACKRFMREDPTFHLTANEESGELIISGMGELHLYIYSERIKREYGINVVTGSPIVNYRETISGSANFNYLHKKQSGGAGQYARVIGRMESMQTNGEASKSNLFVNATQGLNIPGEYFPAIEKSFYECTKKGVLTGFPIVGIKYTLTDGQTHSVDSSSYAFALATKYSFEEGFQKAGPVILEPVMTVEVNVPSEYHSAIVGSLLKRGGNIIETVNLYGNFKCLAEVPLSRMFEYMTELRGCTQGQGEYNMEYKAHAPVPDSMVDMLIEKFKKKKETEKKDDSEH